MANRDVGILGAWLRVGVASRAVFTRGRGCSVFSLGVAFAGGVVLRGRDFLFMSANGAWLHGLLPSGAWPQGAG